MTIVIANAPTATDALPTFLYTNYFATGTVTATSENPLYEVENVGTESTYDEWSPASMPAILYTDAGSAVMCNSAALVAHTCGTAGATVLLAYSLDNITWTLIDSVTPTDDSPILFLFSNITARYWRFRFTGSVAPFVGVAMVGPRFTMPNGVVIPYTPMWASKQYELLTSNSQGGQFLGNRIVRKSAETSISFTSVTDSFAETDLRPFMEHYNQGKAFLFASGPSVFDLDVGYCWRTPSGQIRPTYDENGNWMSVNMEVQCYVE